MSTVIKVENLGKQYRLGEVGTGTLSHDLNRWWAKVRGKEDPFAKIGESNDRASKGESEYVWALKDINFEVKAGEVLGIIGRNGAGKSTLLKILSKVTKPTGGRILTKGRIASLLEVGTGFHPEMTGRENTFLNGAIMGMKRSEIRDKFDEIVDFAGVERYIDTPVKRYSSGMYVRLAFAVAAHLNSEILIVDEVLAVGDAEFQNKCIGKMGDISKGEGRTVLFVSHNMASIRTLTNEAILLKDGSLFKKGPTEDLINIYSSDSISNIKFFDFESRFDANKALQFVNVSLLNENDQKISTAISGTKVSFRIEIVNTTKAPFKDCSVGIGIFTISDTLLVGLKNDSLNKYYTLTPGLNVIICEIDPLPLSNGLYKYNVILNNSSQVFDWIKEVGLIEVENGLFFPNGKVPAAKTPSVLIKHKWL